MNAPHFYPLGTPGQPWGEAELAQWRACQVRQRSYADDVLTAVERLRDQMDVQVYGEVVYAGFWKRVAANIIDSFIVGIVGGIIGAIIGGVLGAAMGMNGGLGGGGFCGGMGTPVPGSTCRTWTSRCGNGILMPAFDSASTIDVYSACVVGRRSSIRFT